MSAWILILAASLPAGYEAPRCDFAEINHAHDCAGQLIFTQLIAWDWDPAYRRHNVQAWAIVSDWNHAGNRVQTRTPSGDRRDLQCKYFQETWTIGDPERENQKVFSVEHRRKVW